MAAALFAFVATLLGFVAIDAVWLKAMAQRTYAAEIGSLLRERPRLVPAMLFYLMFAAGLAFFSVLPGIATGQPLHAALSGAMVGLIAYGTFNLTNLAILRGYSAKIAAIDMVWGIIASALTAGLAAWAGARLFG
jgi:uncharacterized membrane protein